MNTLKAQTRDLSIKAKRLRREGFITGNLYGKEIETSIPLKFSCRESEKTLRSCRKGTQLLLDVEGKVYDALVKEIDFDASRNQLLEIDFQALVQNEKVHSVAEIVLHNKEKIADGVMEQNLEEISYRAYPSDLIDKIMVDVGEMTPGDTIRVKDLDIAGNTKIDLQTDLEAAVVTVVAAKAVSVETPETVEEEQPSEN